MELVHQEEYIIDYNNSHPITNAKINQRFNYFYSNAQRTYDNLPDNMFNLANCVIHLYNDRSHSTDIHHYIEVSKTLWNKLNSYQSQYDFYSNTLSDKMNEEHFNLIYDDNKTIEKNDTIVQLETKKQLLECSFDGLVELYNDILIRVNSHRDSKLFHVMMYENGIRVKLSSIQHSKGDILNSFDEAIEKIKEKNHRRAVLVQCANQNFGYTYLHSIENSLIYKIDSYVG